MPGPRIVQVDAFTDRPFAGNPAAVCVLPAGFGADAAWMQAVAREMNLSETAFAVSDPDEPGTFGLRWFTPAVEVDLCGHATLATAHVLWEEGHLDPGRAATFRTRSGPLRAERGGDGGITLDFPSNPVEAEVDAKPIARALGVPVLFAGRSRFDVLAELGDEAAVRGLAADAGAIRAVEARGLIVTARADPGNPEGADFVSRFFAPRVGIDEDPVTGSAHCVLGPFWADRLGRAALVGAQVSARGGIVRVRVAGGRTFLGGRALTAFSGNLADRFGP